MSERQLAGLRRTTRPRYLKGYRDRVRRTRPGPMLDTKFLDEWIGESKGNYAETFSLVCGNFFADSASSHCIVSLWCCNISVFRQGLRGSRRSRFRVESLRIRVSRCRWNRSGIAFAVASGREGSERHTWMKTMDFDGVMVYQASIREKRISIGNNAFLHGRMTLPWIARLQ